MKELTPKRKQILDFIARYIDEHGFSPSIADIVQGCAISSPSMVQYHLEILEKQGYIKRRPQTSRSLSLLKGPQDNVAVPLLGTIAAGRPIPVPTEDTWRTAADETVRIPAEVLPKGARVFALRVEGISMIDALVDDGDIVIMEATNTADNGQMVAAWLTDREETTLKKLYREPGGIRLQPANPKMKPIFIAPDEIQIQGRVIAVLRKIK